ncbi:neocarzinostatin apoprotein domain-containing protein [Spirillospora sp. NPDC127200]
MTAPLAAVLAALLAPGPVLTAAPVTDLTEGQKITVTGGGFRPGLQSVAVGLCEQGYTGPADCDLGGGATFVNIDAEGGFPAVTLTARARFGGTDCTRRQCVIGVAPLPGKAPPAIVRANTAIVNVGFRGSPFRGGATPAAAAPSAPAAEQGGPSTALWGVTVAVLVLTGAGIAIAQRRTVHAPRRRTQ